MSVRTNFWLNREVSSVICLLKMSQYDRQSYLENNADELEFS